jgi:uncharacterized delta-60 repeat protein
MKILYSLLLVCLVFSVNNHLHAQAALDPNYGNNGTTVIDFATDYDQAFDSYVYDDGRALIMGRVYVGPAYHIDLCRVLADGSPDPSFGNNGRAEFPDFSFTNGLSVRNDGKIMVVGAMNTGANVDMVALLVNENGTIDTDFGDNGFLAITVSPDQTDSAFGIHKASGNRMLITGLVGPFQDANSCVIMIDENGNLDPSFSDDGILIFGNDNYDDYVADAVLLEDESLLVLSAATINGSETGLIFKFDNTGNPDVDFANAGSFSIYANGYEMGVNSMEVLSNGNIAITGSAYDGGNGVTQVLMLNEAGEIVTTFGTNGMATASLENEDLWGYELYEQWNGKLVIMGLSSEFALTRLNTDGTLDLTFDGDGVWIPAVHPLYESMVGGRMLAGDHLVICGSVYSAMADMIFMKFIMDDGASVAENNLTKDFSVFPNPTNNSFFTLTISNSYNSAYDVQLINVLGEVVMDFPQMTGPQQLLEIPSSIGSGHYFVRLKAENWYTTQTLLIHR